MKIIQVWDSIWWSESKRGCDWMYFFHFYRKSGKSICCVRLRTGIQPLKHRRSSTWRRTDSKISSRVSTHALLWLGT